MRTKRPTSKWILHVNVTALESSLVGSSDPHPHSCSPTGPLVKSQCVQNQCQNQVALMDVCGAGLHLRQMYLWVLRGEAAQQHAGTPMTQWVPGHIPARM